MISRSQVCCICCSGIARLERVRECIRSTIIGEPCVGQDLTGLSKGGEQVKRSREYHFKSLEQLIELASLQV